MDFLYVLFIVISLKFINGNLLKRNKHVFRTPINASLPLSQINEIKSVWSSLKEQKDAFVNRNEVNKKPRNCDIIKEYKMEQEKKEDSFAPQREINPQLFDGHSNNFESIVTAKHEIQEIEPDQDYSTSLHSIAPVKSILSAFIVELVDSVSIAKRSARTLNNFSVNHMGSFIKGSSLDLQKGRYSAPVTALYQFYSTVHITRSLKLSSLRPNASVIAMICIDANCTKGSTLKFTSGISSNSKVFTINVTGQLYLVKNQYVEVVVKNNSKDRVTVMSGTMFGGYLIGI
ncbi:adipolin [Hydra vulgaris]|uniref:adipolin n=1 Tax=Hydra vulgaris TaxID=6087 RepID=UPI000640F75C|nr:adipolin [Hydra vulgaris]